MFLPKYFSDVNYLYVEQVFDLAGSLSAGRLIVLRELLDEFFDVDKQIVCSPRTKELNDLFNEEFKRVGGFALDDVAEELYNHGFDKGVVFKLVKWNRGCGYGYYVYCESLDELLEYATQLVVAWEEKHERAKIEAE